MPTGMLEIGGVPLEGNSETIMTKVATSAEKPPVDIAGLVKSQPRAHSLQQALYNSAEAYRHDIERIFMRHWTLAGHTSSAPKPGDYFLFELAEESVIIVRGQDNELRAFANVCRHRGSRICRQPEGHAMVLVCPYHAWAYNLDGSLRSARYMPDDLDKKRYGLKPVHIAVIEGLVFVSLANKPLSLDFMRKALKEVLGPYDTKTAKVAHRRTYRIEANWKLAVENYLECYHCAPAHPEYSKLHALEKPIEMIQDLVQLMEAKTCSLGFEIPRVDHPVPSSSGEAPIFSHRYPLYEGIKSGSADGSPLAPLMGAFKDYDGGVTSTHLWPSCFLAGYADHVVLYRFIPVNAAATSMEIIWLVRGDAKAGVDYDLEKLTWLWRVTTDADKIITEDNQRGVNSRYYEPGPYAPAEPSAIRWIDWYLNEIS